MDDRADDLAKELSHQLYVEGVPLETGVALLAAVLRAYAEEKMQEEAKRLLDQWTQEIVLIRKAARLGLLV